MAWKSEVMRHKIMTLNCSAGIVVFLSTIWTSHMHTSHTCDTSEKPNREIYLNSK